MTLFIVGIIIFGLFAVKVTDPSELMSVAALIMIVQLALQDQSSTSKGYRKGLTIGYDVGYEDAKEGKAKDPTIRGGLL